MERVHYTVVFPSGCFPLSTSKENTVQYVIVSLIDLYLNALIFSCQLWIFGFIDSINLLLTSVFAEHQFFFLVVVVNRISII